MSSISFASKNRGMCLSMTARVTLRESVCVERERCAERYERYDNNTERDKERDQAN